MQLFDLVFIALFVCSAGALIVAAWFAIRGHFVRSRRILLRLLAGAIAYFAVVIATSLVLPRRVLNIGDAQCFDDWCISLTGVQRTAQGDQTSYHVNLKVFSRARRISQRERNMAVYLTDPRGSRYDPLPDSSATPLSVVLGPGDAIPIRRSFLVPSAAPQVAAVIVHEGGFPIGWLIIGYDTWFRKPPIVRLQ